MSNDNDIRARFGRNLKVLRTRHGYTQEVMASALEVKRSSYSGYENGRTEPDLGFLHRLQNRFDIGVDVLLEVDLAGVKAWDWQRLAATWESRGTETLPA